MQRRADAWRKEYAGKQAARGVRPGFHSITPYLIVDGADAMIDFVRRAFGAQPVKRVPAPDGKVMHAEVRIGESILELADSGPGLAPMPASIHLYVPDADAVYRRAIGAGGISSGEPVDQPYGDREAGVKDVFGNEWYIATHKLEAGRYAPEGLRTITPYLHTKGVGDLIEFLKRAFGAEEAMCHQSPDGTILHAKVRIGDSVVEMGEAHGEWHPRPTMLHLSVSDADSVYRTALEAGATSVSAPEDKPYGARVGVVSDPGGNIWCIATNQTA
ncbi:MAG: VOC family protein [Bryobacteraceae bacterium]